MAMKEELDTSLPLPVEKLPECWNKDERMNALFAQFRNQSVNQQDWNSKCTFWRGMISDLLEHTMCCSFTVSELNTAFKRKGRIPLCLPIVIQELYKNGEVVLATDFVKEPTSTWTAWAVDIFVKKPLVWSFSKLKNSISEPVIDNETRYVHVKTVKELGEIILSVEENLKENTVIPLSEVTKNCCERTKRTHITDENVKLALIWLRYNKKAVFRVNSLQKDAELLVKISVHGVKEMSQVEESLYNLTKQEELLVRNLELLECEKNAILKNAKTYLANGLRQVAKNCIRKKKEIEKRIENRAATLQNVQILIARIHDAHSDAEVLTSYKTGCAALKKKLNESNLTEDNVRETMDDLSEVLEEFSELQSALSTSAESFESDSELENELIELMASTTDTSVETEEKLSVPLNLPDVPELEKGLSSLHIHDVPLPSMSSPSVKATKSQSTCEKQLST